MKKQREKIPSDVAAQILFLSDRTCCVCRQKGKPIQIHHIDDNPSNNKIENLVVLCLDCHNLTQISGGFDRKLDSNQIILYRKDWLKKMARIIATESATSKLIHEKDTSNIQLATSLAEIYRDAGEYEILVIHYDVIGNTELRDKYIEKVLSHNPEDDLIILYRSMQNKQDLIPKEVVKRVIDRQTKEKDWNQLGRTYQMIGDYKMAVMFHLKGITESLEENEFFSAAYYAKELFDEGCIAELFKIALKNFSENNDVFWQLRALQELGWDSEIRDLLLKNKEKIEKSDNITLKIKLANYFGDKEKSLKLQKEFAENTKIEKFDSD